MTSCIAQVELQVPFHEVDAARVAWVGHYARYFEVACCHLLDKIGYDAMFASGIIWPIVDRRIRYMRGLCFNRKVSVMATLGYWRQQLKISCCIGNSLDGASRASDQR